MIECVPTERLEVENVAFKTPLTTTSGPEPRVVPPSKNVIMPVAMQQGETVAVSATDCPRVAGLALELSVMDELLVTT